MRLGRYFIAPYGRATGDDTFNMALMSNSISIKNIAMAVARIHLWFLLLAIGGILGATLLAETFLYLGISIRNEAADIDKHYWDDWAGRVQKAVTEEAPEVATWALINYIEILEERFEPDECESWVPEELATAHVTLAVVSRESDAADLYSPHIERALEVSKQCDIAGMQRENDLLLVARMRIERK